MKLLGDNKPGEWLSLSQAANLLGVHPSTVRSWADHDHLPVHRTQGGHRRFKRSDVELWMQSQQAKGPIEVDKIVQNALKRTRLSISESHLESQVWYQKLDDEARDQYRRSGRNLVEGLAGYLSSDQPVADAEARALGYEYASRGKRCGLNCVEATHAFIFFRNHLFSSLLSIYEEAAVHSPYAWSDMYHKVGSFTDQIMITLLETYEAFQRGNR